MATDRLSKEVLLLFFPNEPDHKWIADIQAQYPGLEVRWEHNSTDPSTGKRRAWADLDPGVTEGVTMMCSTNMDLPSVEQIKDVKFVQLVSAGADKWLQHEKYLDPNVLFCTSNGAHAPQIAEWVMGTWLMAQHAFPYYLESMKHGRWDKWTDMKDGPTMSDSCGLRMGILGYGAIGRQCARIGSSLGMEVYAYTRSEKPTPESRKDDSYCVPGTGDADGLIPTKWFHGAEDVDNFLASGLDLLVISLPLTPATTGLINRHQFELMGQRKTFVVNIARGKVIDTDALMEALENETIRGAALDVTDPEPLPSDHPLWKSKNVFITPHVSWATPRIWVRCMGVLEENLGRLSRGEKAINVVNKKFNY